MDVQADQTELQGEHATIVFERPDAVTQGQPAVPRSTSYADTTRSRPCRASRDHVVRSRGACAADHRRRGRCRCALGRGHARVGQGRRDQLQSSITPPHKSATVHTPTSLPSNTPLLTQTSTTGDSASYTIPIAAYSVSVSTGAARSWVSISPSGHRPAFEGVMNPGQSQHQILLGPSTIEIGAGGTTVTVTSGKHSQILKPPAAPFSYQIVPKS